MSIRNVKSKYGNELLKKIQMESLKIDFRYLNNGAPEYYRTEERILPSAFAMHWCMLATDFNRIFTKEDLEEFLFRLCLVLYKEDLLEKWLLTGKLMNYWVHDKKYTLTLDEIIMYFGFEIIDTVENKDSRDRFLNSMDKSIFNAMLVGKIGGFSIMTDELNENIPHVDLDKIPEIRFRNDSINRADFFSKDIMKMIPEEIFTNRSKLLIKKESDLVKRSEQIKNLPIFLFEKIPQSTLNECYSIIFTEDYIETLINNQNLKEVAEPLLYLAWLFANDFLYWDKYDYFPIEGFDLNFEEYIDESGGFKLELTIENYKLEELKPIMKGLF